MPDTIDHVTRQTYGYQFSEPWTIVLYVSLLHCVISMTNT